MLSSSVLMARCCRCGQPSERSVRGRSCDAESHLGIPRRQCPAFAVSSFSPRLSLLSLLTPLPHPPMAMSIPLTFSRSQTDLTFRLCAAPGRPLVTVLPSSIPVQSHSPPFAHVSHRSSPNECRLSTTTPLPAFLMSSVPSFSLPMARAFSLPCAVTITGASFSRAAEASGSWPPAERRPGAMMLAPERMNRIAPRSTRIVGRRKGSEGGRRAGKRGGGQQTVCCTYEAGTFRCGDHSH